MKILAISQKGHEFLYNPKTAHRVPERSATTIRDICNEHGYQLKEGQVWHIHEIDQYDTAYDYAQRQRFSIRKGVVMYHWGR